MGWYERALQHYLPMSYNMDTNKFIVVEFAEYDNIISFAQNFSYYAIHLI